jgi:hypothetical protein
MPDAPKDRQPRFYGLNVTFNFLPLIQNANVGIAEVGVTGSRYAV